MKGDFTHFRFDPANHRRRVYEQQGRVGLDADANEAVDIAEHLRALGIQDVVGPSGAPLNDAGFAIIATGTDLRIGAGRYWVDGLLIENESDVDALLAQPYVPAGASVVVLADGSAGAMPPGEGVYVAFLETWERLVTAAEDDSLREPALGGPDTTVRTQQVWQVRLLRAGDVGTPVSCSSNLPSWSALVGPPTVSMAARSAEPTTPPDDCAVPADAGFRGTENQHYRIEIHGSGGAGDATFKWSRENGSVVTRWVARSGNELTVSSPGRDGAVGFAQGDWVELINEANELTGAPGTLVQLESAGGDRLEIRPATATGTVDLADFPDNPRVRRWDSDGELTVELPPTNDGFIPLELGVEVRFPDTGTFRTGQWWSIPARTALGDVIWPAPGGVPTELPPFGDRHHFARLAIVQFDAGVWTVLDDCRELFPSLTTLGAEKVAFANDACGLVTTEGEPAETVQEALDVLCASHTLEHHNSHLHGWGIVSGLKVVCDPDDPRRVIVRDGWVIDRAGHDIHIPETGLDVLQLVADYDAEPAHASKILTGGVGDAWLSWDPKAESGERFAVEPYSSDWKQELNDRLAQTLLMEFYEDSIADVRRFVEAQLTPPPGTEDDPTGPEHERLAALTNLLMQRANPQAGQHILLTPREHAILLEFYNGLRDELALETFCGLFDDARPFPELFPTQIQGIDTIFGRGQHQRLRLRPGGAEAYSVGPGLSPRKPATTVNRWDLTAGKLVAQINPFAGQRQEASAQKADTGTTSVLDVALSPDGKRIYAVAATRNGEDTLFRVGDIGAREIRWGDVFTICNLKIVTLATTAADVNKVYAIAHKPATAGSKTFKGDGLYRIDPAGLAAGTQPTRVGPQFNAVGHLRIAKNGAAWASEGESGGEAKEYTGVRTFSNVAATSPTTSLVSFGGLRGRDDIAVFTAEEGARVQTLYAVAETSGGAKVLLAYQGVNRVAQVALENTAIRLEPYAPTGMLLMTSEDGYAVRLLDMDKNTKVANFVPTQLGPIAVAADPVGRRVHVLNYVSSTLTVASGDLFRATPAFPVAQLAAYRRDAVNAYGDLLGRFLEYLKDCLCEHLLVANPDTAGDSRIYLGAVAIRVPKETRESGRGARDASRVYKVCNLSRRRYVKSFPAIGHWLSLVPILPFLDLMVELFCCWVLPDAFGRYSVDEYDESRSAEPQVRFPIGRAREGTDVLQAFDALGALGGLFGKFMEMKNVAGDAT